jgi:hypothetical protein
MKRAILVVVLTATWATMVCSAQRATTDNTKPQRANLSPQPAGHARPVAKNRPHNATTVPLPKSRPPVANNEKYPAPGRVGVSQTASHARLGKGSAAYNETHGLSAPRSVRSSVAVRTSVSATSSVRHRSPNPPIAGRSIGAGIANTGGLNGSQMRRRP